MDMKVCKDCGEEKFEDQFYNYKAKICKYCLLVKDRIKRVEEIKNKGGSERVPPSVNTWADETQKEQTQQFLILLGYKQNKENNVWYKLPWKTKDGDFPKIEKLIRHKGTPTTYQMEDIMKWVELRKKDYTYVKLSDMYNVPPSTIRHFVIKYLDK